MNTQITKEQKEVAENLKKQGYYILVSIDKRKRMKMYEVTKNENQEGTQRTAKCELNKAGYLLAKNQFSFDVVKQETSFLNFVPFAHENKSKEPLQRGFLVNN